MFRHEGRYGPEMVFEYADVDPRKVTAEELNGTIQAILLKKHKKESLLLPDRVKETLFNRRDELTTSTKDFVLQVFVNRNAWFRRILRAQTLQDIWKR